MMCFRDWEPSPSSTEEAVRDGTSHAEQEEVAQAGGDGCSLPWPPPMARVFSVGNLVVGTC